MHTVETLCNSIAFLLEAGAGAGIVYTVVSCISISRFLESHASDTSPCCPGVTVIKPLCGDEWNLSEHLGSFLVQDYAGPVQYIFGVCDAEDIALKTVSMLRHRFPEQDITIVTDARLYGSNRKIANLINMMSHAAYDVICFADSDVLVDRSYLRKIVSALQQPGVGVVTCAYRSVCAPGFWSRVGAAMTDYHFLPGVITGLLIGRARPCFGQTIAMTRSTLSQIGGLEQFSDHLAEDYAIGDAVRRIGLTVAIPRFFVCHARAEKTLSQLCAQELRWSRTVYAADRRGHQGAVFMHPLSLAVLATLASMGSPVAVALVGASLAARMLLVFLMNAATGRRQEQLWWLPLCDVLQFSIYVGSFCSTRVTWRGEKFQVSKNGLLSSADASDFPPK
ncbi:bacteriohopanetetrol glucosamine biosynthesis glycosyltransferase HpnI [Caballeronia sp. BR00000012568055]|uniref:bacteriohopanetetrol glucosamine biosynthesis glycosyltransferase HpnI n=1 Tax=Caballeronia sp. BR00000012568055 TaxID=2918761 RepID=UPI0023F84DA4